MADFPAALLGGSQAELEQAIDKAVKLESTDRDPANPVTVFKPISLKALMAKKLPPLFFVVEGLLPQGLALLVSSPKMGKSWLCLWLGLCASAGRPFLGFQTNRCRCLYLALEDSERRLQARLERLLNGEPAPDNFDIVTRAPMLNSGLLEVLENYVKQYPDTRLVIIDTLAKVRAGTVSSSNAYAADYADMTSLKNFADAHGICLLLVHHLRKMNDGSDVFNRISGTNGIFGAADTALVLSREHRDDTDTVLSISGRDVNLDDLSLTFDKESCRWERQGTVSEMRAAQELAEYEAAPFVRTIKRLVKDGGGSWSGEAKDILLAAELYHTGYIADSARGVTAQITKFERDLLDRDGIQHSATKNGNAGAKHRFELVADEFTEVSNDEPDPFDS